MTIRGITYSRDETRVVKGDDLGVSSVEVFDGYV
jgi:hypothetical protein